MVEVNLDRSARRRIARTRGRKARSTAKGEPHGRAACSESGIEVSGRAASSRHRACGGREQHDGDLVARVTMLPGDEVLRRILTTSSHRGNSSVNPLSIMLYSGVFIKEQFIAISTIIFLWIYPLVSVSFGCVLA